MSNNNPDNVDREVRSFLMAREPSVDRTCRPRPESRRERLFNEISEEEIIVDDDDDDDSNSTLSATEEFTEVFEETTNKTSQTENTTAADIGAKIYLRLRPVGVKSDVFTISDDVLVVGPSSESTSTSFNKNKMEKQFVFSAIFDGAVGQGEIFESCVGRKIETEESFTLLAYGTSGSGKTFTLTGEHKNPGIIPRSLEKLFTLYSDCIFTIPAVKLVKARVTILDDFAISAERQLRKHLLGYPAANEMHTHAELQKRIQAEHGFQKKSLNQVSVMIWISFVEIYNECVYDLLALPVVNAPNMMAPPPRNNLKIVGNNGKMFIKGLTAVYVKSSLEALQLLHEGLQRVNYASTVINANSSRSHCIFTVDLLKNHNGIITQTSYKFCDLAGSERLVKTGNAGFRLKETQKINTSLMVLGRCLDAANSNRKKSNDMIPFRESKLTMLLQSALLGHEKLLMIVNVTPTEKYYEETMNVLSFSAIAKNIVFKPCSKPNNARFSLYNETVYTSTQTQSEYIEELKTDISRLRAEISQNEARHCCEISQIEARHRCEMLNQEQELRNRLVDSFQLTLQQHKRQAELRLEQEKESLNRYFEHKLAAQKRLYDIQIEDLEEELDDVREINKKLIEEGATAAKRPHLEEC